MRSVALRCLSGARRRLYVPAASPVTHCISLRARPKQLRWISQTTTSEDVVPEEQNDISSGEQTLEPTATAGTPEQPVDSPQETDGKRNENHPLNSTLGQVTGFERGSTVALYGFLGKRRDKSSRLSFCNLDTGGLEDVQIVSKVREDEDKPWVKDLHQKLKATPAYSPVRVGGVLEHRPRPARKDEDEQVEGTPEPVAWDIQMNNLEVFNEFSKDIIVSEDAVWSPSQRHLQLRFDPLLRKRLALRSSVNFEARKYLMKMAFHEYETPVLFKSTPEGAREFLVPTRQPGLAYALPQSPQQSKQVLMASGILRYFQFARCFRDEDSRADRQPEFTQLDIEMGFARRKDVMKTVEGIINSVFHMLRVSEVPREVGGVLYSSAGELFARYDKSRDPDSQRSGRTKLWPLRDLRFHPLVQFSYKEVMEKFGTDKPDLRIPTSICRVEHLLSEDFQKMITSLEDPIVEAIQFKLNDTPSEHMAFIREFMENLPKTTLKFGSSSAPGVFVFDESKPLNGLSALGHQAGEEIASMESKYWPRLQNGDLLIVHARERTDFKGEGWTELGRLRKTIYDAAVQKGLIERDIGFRFCWVKNFPLFTPDIDPGEGQGGAAGVKATHHPFTAPIDPLTAQDWENIENGKPWLVRGDHYDLVLNGNEIGGGSRRIHNRAMQETVMRSILKMPESGIAQFKHLLDALDAGCPPHAGFALGWDRFISLLCDVDSVRDVLAFPKNQKGEDLFASSPSQLTKSQLDTYHLTPSDWAVPETEA
ncbi:hypothetical protein PFICI_06845 [Pestalotiopsis fici W106-1]|uniref:Aminoacyl-transfer RNA synthetases class-II family profile domain-containing protein n=1 Tax=Pestalotiopsis fici (strain W106-1 / CGMCC3.15140) TaxID=1229662 RepID=W3X6V2_PESFW|nr:uncharacterized protein PFICI_06845 [Pestalotiopsis fici W106-1]ETS81843.1 hypothetical protein PFICI_06845 [Pestalotiopsis fici W106-1]